MTRLMSALLLALGLLSGGLAQADEAALLTLPGTLVQVREGTEPARGWGDVTKDDIGQIASVKPDGTLAIAFADKDVTEWIADKGEVAPVIGVGMVVERGPDWKWEDQDGGKGGRGRVASIDEDNWVTVNWDSGTENSYRWGIEGAYDLRPVAFGSHPKTLADGTAPDAAALAVQSYGGWVLTSNDSTMTFGNEEGKTQVQIARDSNGWFTLTNQAGTYVVYSDLHAEEANDPFPPYGPAAQEAALGVTTFGDWIVRIGAEDIFISHKDNGFDLRLWRDSNGWFEVYHHDGETKTFYSADKP